jgi:hypothetical protein
MEKHHLDSIWGAFTNVNLSILLNSTTRYRNVRLCKKAGLEVTCLTCIQEESFPPIVSIS